MPVEYQASAERFLSNFAEGTSDYKLVKKACDLAWEGHYAQEPRKDGSPYFSHPLAVANILIEWGVGAKEVAAALCHDLIEDGKINGERITREFIEEKLGKRVAQLIEGVTELGKEPEFNGVEKPSDVDIFKKWLGYGAKDLGSLIIKLADRLHNMRTLAYTSEESQRLKSEETLKVYTRVADILGMWEVKRELEDLCFKYLHPEIYEQIMMKRTEIIAQNEDVIQNIIAEMQDGLTDLKMEIELFPEARFIYELYQRMEYRGLLLEELFPTDIWRINIVVPEKRDCHLVEGEIHDNLYPPVQGETYNYIAEPRPNGHQFLHSYVKVPRFGRLLIQIRDKEMQRNYKYGVVSKVNGRSDWFKEDFTWLKALMDYLKSEGVTENALYRMFAAVTEPIEVYTSQGKKIQLPFGATALDFAAQIHTKVFGKAKEAIINGRPTPLSTVLQDADEVWIVKGEETRPKLEWIDWIRTPRALKLLRA
ncbi:MAG: HD domain-containing protein, partial [Candidatus Margulisbacteria bacterium]|nr:HD domain-containing protein [Candidatus Margulisiibacteriota bacterium]